MSKCVIFDLDGTILDTIETITYFVNMTFGEMGIDPILVEDCKYYAGNGARVLIERALASRGITDEESIRDVLAVYKKHYDDDPFYLTRPFDGIVEMLLKLRQAGYLLAVVSNKPERHVKMLCDIFFGENTFSYISGTGGDKPVKPNKECVELALSTMGESAENLIYVGDSHVDVKTAHNAGVPCVGVTWGFHGKDGFKDQVPDYYVDNTDQLYAIISGDENE